MKQEIIVTVDANGDVTVEVHGVKGKSCKAMTEFMAALGTTSATKHTAEYYAAESVNQKIGGGNPPRV